MVELTITGKGCVGEGTIEGFGLTYTADQRVDTYFSALPDWQQAICPELRELIQAADQYVTGTIKRTNVRTLSSRATGETINGRALAAMFKQIIANNRAGGWGKLNRNSQHGGQMIPDGISRV